MRVNLRNAVSFELVGEKQCGFAKVENGLNKNIFIINDTENIKVKKSHIKIDFGSFERIIWFDSEEIRDNFVSEFLPSIFYGALITD